MKKIATISVLLIIFILIFNNFIIGKYFSHKLSNWVSREVYLDHFSIDYPEKITIKNIEIKNSGREFKDNIFFAQKIDIIFDYKSFLFSDLIIIKNLNIYEPEFFLNIIQNKKNKIGKKNSYKDNIGVADKIYKELPDKVWPKKVRDVNFLIKNAKLINPRAHIQVFSKNKKTKINLSNMSFNNVGNEKGYQHYKEVLKFIFFDIVNRVVEPELKRFLKNTYNF